MRTSTRTPRWLLAALGSSILSDAAVPVVLSFAALSGGATPARVGVLLASSDAMMVIFLLVGGVAADRFGRRRIALLASSLRLLSMSGFAVFLLLFPWNFTVAAVLAGLWGIGAGFFFPTATGLVADSVTSENLQSVNGWRGMVESVGQSVGPSIAGVVVGIFQPTAGALVCAVGVAVSMFSLARLPSDSKDTAVNPQGSKAASMVEELKEGWHELISRDWCWKIIVGYSVLHLLAFGPLFVLGPVLAKRSLGGAAGWGLILGAVGVGSVVGAWRGMKLRFRYPLRAVIALSLLVSLLFFALGFGASMPIVIAAAFIAGAVFGVMGVVWETYLQLEFPPDVLSRVSSYDWMGSLALFPIGQILSGVLAPKLGIATVLIGAGVSMLVVSIVMLATRSIWSARAIAPQDKVASPLAGTSRKFADAV